MEYLLNFDITPEILKVDSNGKEFVSVYLETSNIKAFGRLYKHGGLVLEKDSVLGTMTFASTDYMKKIQQHRKKEFGSLSSVRTDKDVAFKNANIAGCFVLGKQNDTFGNLEDSSTKCWKLRNTEIEENDTNPNSVYELPIAIYRTIFKELNTDTIADEYKEKVMHLLDRALEVESTRVVESTEAKDENEQQAEKIEEYDKQAVEKSVEKSVEKKKAPSITLVALGMFKTLTKNEKTIELKLELNDKEFYSEINSELNIVKFNSNDEALNDKVAEKLESNGTVTLAQLTMTLASRYTGIKTLESFNEVMSAWQVRSIQGIKIRDILRW